MGADVVIEAHIEFASDPESEAGILDIRAEHGGKSTGKHFGQGKAFPIQRAPGGNLLKARAAGRVAVDDADGWAGDVISGVGVSDQHRGAAVIGKSLRPVAAIGSAKEEYGLYRFFGVVGQGIQGHVVAQVQPGIGEELEIVLDIGRAPGLGRVLDKRIVQGQPRGVAALHLPFGALGLQPLGAEIDKSRGAQRQTRIGRQAIVSAIAVVVPAAASRQGKALGIVFELKVDNTGNGIGAVLGRRAVAQHLYLL